MSSAKSQLARQAKRQFLSTVPYNNDIFTYTTQQSFTSRITTGVLRANVVGATASTCPAGRILIENGLKLYPGVNNSVNTFMVGVYDTQSLLTGYIDPNAAAFAIYSTELPPSFTITGPYSSSQVDPGPQGLADQGPPVYTNGLVYAAQSVQAGQDISAGTTIYAGQSITAANSIHANTYIQIHGDLSAGTIAYTGTGGTICASGQILVSAITSQDTSAATVTINPALGQVFYVNFTGTAATPVTFDLPVGTTIANYTGATLYITMLNSSSTATINASFATPNFRTNGTFAITTTAGTNRVTFAFYCNGTSFVEIGQTYVNSG
jgi:hypothetical protein